MKITKRKIRRELLHWLGAGIIAYAMIPYSMIWGDWVYYIMCFLISWPYSIFYREIHRMSELAEINRMEQELKRKLPGVQKVMIDFSVNTGQAAESLRNLGRAISKLKDVMQDERE